MSRLSVSQRDSIMESHEPTQQELALFMLKRVETDLEEDIRWIETKNHKLFETAREGTYKEIVAEAEDGRVIFLGRTPGFVNESLVKHIIACVGDRFPGLNTLYGINYLCAVIQELSLLEELSLRHHAMSPKIFRVLTRERVDLVRKAMKFHLVHYYQSYIARDNENATNSVGYFAIVNDYKPLEYGVAFTLDGTLKKGDLTDETVDNVKFALGAPVTSYAH